MDAPTIIAAFGGRSAVSKLTGAKPNAVTQWRRDGIPARYWHVLVHAAAEKRIEGITFDVLEGTHAEADAA